MRTITFHFIYSFEITSMILVQCGSLTACCQTRKTNTCIRSEDSCINNTGLLFFLCFTDRASPYNISNKQT